MAPHEMRAAGGAGILVFFCPCGGWAKSLVTSLTNQTATVDGLKEFTDHVKQGVDDVRASFCDHAYGG